MQDTAVSSALAAAGKAVGRQLRLIFPHDDAPAGAALLANKLNAWEGLSRDFCFTVEVLHTRTDIALKDVLGKMVTIELTRRDGSLRFFNGYVFDFRYVKKEEGFAYYDMVLLPWLAFLRYRKDNFMFHGQPVQEQTRLTFADYRAADWEPRHLDGDEPMTDACQFDETDYNYLHRRWEALGWHYHYEHRADGHTLVLSGNSTLSDPLDGGGGVQWQRSAQASAAGLWSLVPVRTLASTAYAASSFDFKNPRPLATTTPSANQQGAQPALEVYEYAGAYGFKDAAAGETFVRLRMEELEARAKHFQASGDDDHAQAGRSFVLKGSPDLPAGAGGDNEFLVLEVTHTASDHHETRSGSASEYSMSLSCLRKKIPWRPSRSFNSEEPRIYGVQTAIVVGPAGEEIHTDEYGRVRVQFHWDREGSYDEKSSAWVRVASTWAGSNFGFMAVPRIGQEVIVQWLDGSPDRPLITGRLYNQRNMPPWELPANATQSGVLTRSSKGGAYGNANAIRFEDKEGAEQLWLHAEKDQLTEVENDEDKWVGNDRRKTIDGHETTTVHKNRTERVDLNEKVSIGLNRTEDVGINETVSIGANRNVTIGANKVETIALAKFETIGAFKALSIGAAYQTTVGAFMNTSVAAYQSAQIGQDKTTTVGASYTITVTDKFTIKVGKASLVMASDGTITINGHTFSVGTTAEQTLKADGEITIKAKKILEN